MSKNYLLILNATDKNRFNCVLWAREKVASLPFGLWTITDKRKIINSNNPKAGSVAIIKTGFIWGHVAVVVKVGSNHITIKEANFKYGKITERHGTEKDLKIVGYFKP
ncbi:MAG: CHAP domain-containing protein [Patescibacteria group bacterium]